MLICVVRTRRIHFHLRRGSAWAVLLKSSPTFLRVHCCFVAKPRSAAARRERNEHIFEGCAAANLIESTFVTSHCYGIYAEPSMGVRRNRVMLIDHRDRYSETQLEGGRELSKCFIHFFLLLLGRNASRVSFEKATGSYAPISAANATLESRGGEICIEANRR